MNGRVWGLKLSLFIKTDCICGLTYKALPKLDLFRQIIVPVWSLFYTKSCIDFITRNWITELGYIGTVANIRGLFL
jgi:hypothetical protein